MKMQLRKALGKPWLALWIVTPLLVAGCTGPVGPTMVLLRDAKFSPPQLDVSVGTTVMWRNDDSMAHTVTPAEPTQWGTPGSEWLTKGERWSYTFAANGSFDYYCIPHAFKDGDHLSGMVGTVVVRTI